MASIQTSWGCSSTEASPPRLIISSSGITWTEVTHRASEIININAVNIREAESWDHLPASCLQDQVPREFLLTPRKPWVCFHQQDLWILWWMWGIIGLNMHDITFTWLRQEALQHQAVEDFHRLFQLLAHRRHCGWEDFLLSRRPQPRPPEYGADQTDHEADRRPGHRSASPPQDPWYCHHCCLQGCCVTCCGQTPTRMSLDGEKTTEGWVTENNRVCEPESTLFVFQVSFTFGADVVSKFLNRHDLDLICRAHQVRSGFLLL